MKPFAILSKNLLLGGIIILLAACEKDDEVNNPPKDSSPYTKSLIGSYIDTPSSNDEIQSWVLQAPEDEPWTNIYLALTCSPDNEPIRIQPLQDDSAEKDPEALKKAAKYDSLATAHKDITYDRYTDFQIPDCLYRRTTAIHVVSDADYDSEHPAGTYLDDIINIRFTSAEDYLATGYSSRSTYLGETTWAPLYVPGYLSDNDFWLSENLAEFNQIQRKLIQFTFTFILDKGPDQTGEHHFTFTYMNEDGLVLTSTTPKFKINPD